MQISRQEPFTHERPKTPPYAREFVQARRSGEYINPWLFAGRGAWQRAAQRGPGRLVLPEGAALEEYDWGCVSGTYVVVQWPEASAPKVAALCVLLVRAGARTALALEDVSTDRRSGAKVVTRPYRRFAPRAAL